MVKERDFNLFNFKLGYLLNGIDCYAFESNNIMYHIEYMNENNNMKICKTWYDQNNKKKFEHLFIGFIKTKLELQNVLNKLKILVNEEQ